MVAQAKVMVVVDIALVQLKVVGKLQELVVEKLMEMLLLALVYRESCTSTVIAVGYTTTVRTA